MVFDYHGIGFKKINKANERKQGISMQEIYYERFNNFFSIYKAMWN